MGVRGREGGLPGLLVLSLPRSPTRMTRSTIRSCSRTLRTSRWLLRRSCRRRLPSRARRRTRRMTARRRGTRRDLGRTGLCLTRRCSGPRRRSGLRLRRISLSHGPGQCISGGRRDSPIPDITPTRTLFSCLLEKGNYCFCSILASHCVLTR